MAGGGAPPAHLGPSAGCPCRGRDRPRHGRRECGRAIGSSPGHEFRLRTGCPYSRGDCRCCRPDTAGRDGRRGLPPWRRCRFGRRRSCSRSWRESRVSSTDADAFVERRDDSGMESPVAIQGGRQPLDEAVGGHHRIVRRAVGEIEEEGARGLLAAEEGVGLARKELGLVDGLLPDFRVVAPEIVKDGRRRRECSSDASNSRSSRSRSRRTHRSLGPAGGSPGRCRGATCRPRRYDSRAS